MATGMLMDLAIGPYSGKETGEYNLTRMKMLQSGVSRSRDARSMSFNRSLVLMGTSWLMCNARGVNESLVDLGTALSLDDLVGHREGRNEPRANKRSPKVLKLLTMPCAAYQAHRGSAA
jgi:putative transposase